MSALPWVDDAASIAGFLAVVLPPMAPLSEKARDWLFGKVGKDGLREPPTPLARATLAGMGGIFGAGIILLGLPYIYSPRIDLFNGLDGEAKFDNTPEKKNDDVIVASVICEKGIIIGVHCHLNNGSAGVLFASGVNAQSHVGECIWRGVKDQRFSGIATPVCMN